MAPKPPAPFSEPLLPQLDLPVNPYYTEKHHRLRAFVRNYIDTEIAPYAQEWEIAGQVPESVRLRHCQLGFAITHPVIDPADAGGLQHPAGIPFDEWDTWCGVIVSDEINRLGWCGPMWGLGGGNGIGCPPISRFGTKEQRQRWLPKVARGEYRFCLGITEPDGGSDVANIKTTAERDGNIYRVNGSKKWITNGIWSDYAAMAVRTSGAGPKGLSMIWVPLKGHPGVDLRRIKVSGQRSGGTTFIDLEDVEVPVENLIGEEGQGMRYIMTNFNHERLTICISATRQARVALSSAFAYVLKREAFGAPLINIGVVRHRLSKAGCLLESHWAWIEQLVYQMVNMKKEDADIELGGLTAAAKAHTGIVLRKCADCLVLLMGGNGYTRSGQGEIAERMWREVNGIRIP